MRKRLIGCLVGCLLPSNAARAQAAGRLSIDVEGRAPCANQGTVREALRAEGVEGGASRLAFRIRIDPREGKVLAAMSIRAGEAASSRVVIGDTCEEVLSAVATIIALALEHEEPEDAARPSVHATEEPVPAHYRPSVGGQLAVFGLHAARLGALAFVGLRRPGRAFAPEFRAGAVWTAFPVDAYEAHVSFALWLVHADVCLLRAALGRRVTLAPCAVGELGAVAATSSSVAGATSTVRPWASLGVAARADLAITELFGLEMQVGALVPLVRDRYAFDPGVTVWTAPYVVPWASAGPILTF